MALATRSDLGRRADTRHDNNCRHNGNNGHTTDNGRDDAAPVLGLLGLGRRNKRLRGLGGLGYRFLITRLRRHMSRGTLRSVLPRRSGRRRIPYRKRHRLRLVLNSAHATAAARAKHGAIGYLSSALSAILRISRLSSQPQCARAVLPTTPYERNLHSCCATLPPRPKLCRFTTINRPDLSTLLYKKTKPQVNESVIIGKSRYGRGVPIHRSKPA